MKVFSRRLLFIVILIAALLPSRAQDVTSPRPAKQVLTIVLPLYLDSAFDGAGQYRFGKQFPKYFLPGLEFYEGVQLAVDSLNKEKLPLEVHVVDSKSKKSIFDVLQEPALQSANLILAQVANNEIRAFADFATKKQIPFINVNLPNDGGITNNPFMVILNSTLATHCEGIYKFLQKNHAGSTVIVFRKAGAQEDRLRNYFNDVEKSTTGPKVKIRWVTLPSTFTADQLTPYLDSGKTTLCVAGSLDENFARTLCAQLSAIHTEYPVQVMGMPTWDNIKEFDRKDFKDLEILYTTPFNPLRTDPLSESINTYFRDKLYSRPSDMVFRGYETTYRFGRLLVEMGPNIASGIGVKKYKVFTDFDIQPVLLDKQKQQLDYFENRKIYVIKKLNGVASTVF
ncbi:ABC transporter substrate-binding protein [Flavihumibacter petaseus]|uniref:Leucine-binding protein domain-containing protein n=1 Tax=Flavihumibacter petaseus NBRC 106054 TaxID=1220578 RepID=A0A0E9MVU1_9BACT|nr:ABC transporter substrate-binding protein [Flavihumibacter petaseus]GAO41245.1 hypothetical protein FPE01S_01_02570 [Flavihumibacter petaseus NBRC 106054]